MLPHPTNPFGGDAQAPMARDPHGKPRVGGYRAPTVEDHAQPALGDLGRYLPDGPPGTPLRATGDDTLNSGKPHK